MLSGKTTSCAPVSRTARRNHRTARSVFVAISFGMGANCTPAILTRLTWQWPAEIPRFLGIWASFDGQAYIVDDMLKAQGLKRGDVVLVSIDGGAETYRRIADPESLISATVAIPFEAMGRKALEAVDGLVRKKLTKETFTAGPYLFMDAELVDASNVKSYLK